MVFPVSGVQLKFFRAKTRPENAVWMLRTEVGALFRLEHAVSFHILRMFGSPVFPV
jgi:hypothetical protein